MKGVPRNKKVLKSVLACVLLLVSTVACSDRFIPEGQAVLKIVPSEETVFKVTGAASSYRVIVEGRFALEVGTAQQYINEKYEIIAWLTGDDPLFDETLVGVGVEQKDMRADTEGLLFHSYLEVSRELVAEDGEDESAELRLEVVLEDPEGAEVKRMTSNTVHGYF